VLINNIGDDEGEKLVKTIDGLSRVNFDYLSLTQEDERFIGEFEMTDSLINQIVAGGTIGATLDNDDGVNLVDSDDFNSFSMTYNAGSAAVPLPATAPLFLGALGLLAFRARRARRD
jgi:hypothetical protein